MKPGAVHCRKATSRVVFQRRRIVLIVVVRTSPCRRGVAHGLPELLAKMRLVTESTPKCDVAQWKCPKWARPNVGSIFLSLRMITSFIMRKDTKEIGSSIRNFIVHRRSLWRGPGGQQKALTHEALSSLRLNPPRDA